MLEAAREWGIPPWQVELTPIRWWFRYLKLRNTEAKVAKSRRT